MASRRKGRYSAIPALTVELPLYSTPPNRDDDWTTNDTHVVNESSNIGLPATESKLSATTNIAKVCTVSHYRMILNEYVS